jgi:two-component system response regulator YesN
MWKILIVDDEMLVRQSLKMIIQRKFANLVSIEEAKNGKEAVERYESTYPDLVIMDIKMPIMDGLEAAGKILDGTRDPAVVLLTAYADFEFAQRAVKLGVKDYILKPPKPDEVVEVIQRYLQENHLSFDSNLKAILHTVTQQILVGDYKKAKTAFNQYVRMAHDDRETERVNLRALFMALIEQGHDLGRPLENFDLEGFESTFFTRDKTATAQYMENTLNQIFDWIIEKKISSFDTEIEFAVNYINRHYKENPSLQEVADYMNLSAHYMSKLFKRETGENFSSYLTRCRMEEAKDRIQHTDENLIAIAYELGFNEPNYFSRVFKKMEGVTPSQYRNRVRRKSDPE